MQDYVTVPQIAQMAGCTVRTVWRAIAKGSLVPDAQFEGVIRNLLFKKEMVVGWMLDTGRIDVAPADQSN